jgi:hypothetical protein
MGKGHGRDLTASKPAGRTNDAYGAYDLPTKVLGVESVAGIDQCLGSGKALCRKIRARVRLVRDSVYNYSAARRVDESCWQLSTSPPSPFFWNV